MAEEILVTPRYLKGKEKEWTELVKKSRTSFLGAAEHVQVLTQSFDGRPVKELAKRFALRKEEGIAAFRAFENHIGKLGQIAEVYEQAERDNRNVTTEN
ncbi:MAG: hypothetical protein K2O16_00640 [Lachnospiraceae bacterium]|nr:hypothetical protein [Lachnospiraceae bacterium]MDE7330739.1 hypothetical protein [Lachnospiraceae bacterium]